MTPRQAMLARLEQAARRRLQWPDKPAVAGQRGPHVPEPTNPGPRTPPDKGQGLPAAPTGGPHNVKGK